MVTVHDLGFIHVRESFPTALRVALRVLVPWSIARATAVITDSEFCRRDIEARYLSAGSHFWVAEIKGAPVGMTGIERVDSQTGRLRRMRVTTDHRSKGIAQALLETAERFCREQGYRRLVLDTTEHQTAAHRLYEKNSFTRTGERTLGPFQVFDYVKDLR